MKKRVLSLLLALAMCLSLSVPAWAELPNANALSSLASQHILITEEADGTTYSNLQEFYSAAREYYPTISDYELAAFTFSYVQPETVFLLESLSQEAVLDYLTFLSVTTDSTIMRVSNNGSVNVASFGEIQGLSEQNAVLNPNGSWTTEDNYIQFYTTKAKGNMNGTDRKYTLGVTARWLAYPSDRYTDTLAITYGGAFDDSVTASAIHYNYGTCSYCGATKCLDESISYGIPASGGSQQYLETSNYMSFDFSRSQAAGVKTDLTRFTCFHSNSNGTPINYFEESNLHTTLSFGVLVPNTTETRAAYAHTKRDISVDISASVSGSGIVPTFSATEEYKTANYIAPPLTLTVY